ncbi:LOW QUALITY PROTEIN: hypothetical protein V1477_005181 [Vespula maculifrons]|uniref:Transmembrane protein n=1 Tax=Vespula maculifrons TaxID=7453 RepID=A0ABD2CP06_VESMC
MIYLTSFFKFLCNNKQPLLIKYCINYTFLRILYHPYNCWCSQKKGEVFYSRNLFNLLVFLYYDIFCYLLRNTKLFMLHIESCIRIIKQINVLMNLSKCLKQQCYVMSIFVFCVNKYDSNDIRTLI